MGADDAHPRLFAAVVPEPRLTAELDRRLRPVRALLPKARWVAPDKQHFTLQFFGSVDRGLVDALVSACEHAAAGCAPFALRLRGGGAFPSVHRARVLWLGVTQGASQLTQLAAALAASATELGIALEPREFSPHLTLARLARPAHVEQVTHALVPIDLHTMVRELRLIRSHTDREGARYESLACVPLSAERAAPES